MWRILLVGLVTAGVMPVADAAELRGRVSDAKGAVEDAVIYATPLAGPAPPTTGRAVIDQVGKLYVPFVSAIRTGTTVAFPNKDNIKHHLYSVSPANPFERPLYEGRKAPPVLFDKPGEVTLGCNIHDWMIAHVLVVETPYSAVTDRAGRAVITGLPAGDYAVRVWHPGMKGKRAAAQNPRRITLQAAAAEVDFKIRLRLKRKWWREKPEDADKAYPEDDGLAVDN